MTNIRTGSMTTVREINAACDEACYGRGAGEVVMGMLGANKMIRITRARTWRGILQGRTMNGDWLVLTAASF